MSIERSNRGRLWLKHLSGQAGVVAGAPASVLRVDGTLGSEKVCFLAVVPDAANPFPRARHGEVGLLEGWTLAKYIREVMQQDTEGPKRTIIAVVDVTSQAYGRREELMGVHQACAAATDAYAQARLAGHAVVALIVGSAMSGAFLAHGYQANRILAVNDPKVIVHAMGRQAAARVTRRSVEDLNRLGEKVLPMSYDIRNYAKLGLLSKVLDGINADSPPAADVERVKKELLEAIADIRKSKNTDLTNRLFSPEAQKHRAASIEVRRRLTEQWEKLST